MKIPDCQRLGAVNDGWNVSLTTLMNERMSIGAGVSTGFPELFEFCNGLMLDDGPAIEDRNVRSKLANWAVKASGLKYTSMRAISALSKGERPGPENSIGKLVAGSMIQDVAAYALDLQGAAGVLSGPEDAEADRQIPGHAAARARHPRRGRHRRDHAQHHRRARARACPATSGSTRTCRSTRYRPRDRS